MLLFLAAWATCALFGAVLMSVAGKPAWEGALAGVVFGPLGVLVALYVAVRARRAIPDA